MPAPDTDNYQPLPAIGWQVHVYGEARADVRAWCDQHHLPLHMFAWRPAYQKAGLAQDAVYLLRPDTYVALADPHGSVATLNRYFEERRIRLTS